MTVADDDLHVIGLQMFIAVLYRQQVLYVNCWLPDLDIDQISL